MREHVPPGDFGQANVEQYDIDLRSVPAIDFDGLGAVERGKNPIPLALEEILKKGHHIFLVFDDENSSLMNPVPASLPALCSIPLAIVLFRRLAKPEVNTKRRAASRFACDIDESVVVFDDPVRNREPKPGPLTQSLRLEEGLEDPRRDVR